EILATWSRRDLIKRSQDGSAIVAGQRTGVARVPGHERHQRGAVSRCELSEPTWLSAHFFKRRKNSRQTRKQRCGLFKIGFADEDTRIAPVKRRAFFAESRERIRNSRGPGSRPRSAQDRPFERRDGARVPTFALAQSEQRMFEERQQRYRRQSAEDCFGYQPREPPCRRVGERIA